MEIKIKDNKEKVTEFYLEKSGDDILVMSDGETEGMTEFRIHPDMSWNKMFSGNLDNEPKA